MTGFHPVGFGSSPNIGDIMDEKFLDVVGYEDIFQISNTGKVFSKRTNKILKHHVAKSGYCTLATKVNGLNVAFRIHRLVATAFLANPENKPEVNHLDGNKANNIVSNLEWVTSKENIRHAFATGLKTVYSGIGKWNSKLSEEDVRAIRLSTKSARELSTEYNVHHTQISRVKRRVSYKNVS